MAKETHQKDSKMKIYLFFNKYGSLNYQYICEVNNVNNVPSTEEGEFVHGVQSEYKDKVYLPEKNLYIGPVSGNDYGLAVSPQSKTDDFIRDNDTYLCESMISLNKKLAACKFVKGLTSFGLKDAKRIVDAVMDDRTSFYNIYLEIKKEYNQILN